MTTRDEAFWKERWSNRQTGFHEGKPNELLVAHVDRLEATGKPLRILVPLAGKSADLWWLAARGHDVVGVELVQQAIDELFTEAGCSPERRALGRHAALGAKGVTMVCGDFLAMRPEDLGRFDAVYDRAALIALEPSTRESYVATCRALLDETGRTLLVSVTYDQTRTHGPPWSIDEKTVRALYAGRPIEVLATRSATPNPRLREAGIQSLDETAYSIG